MLNDFSACTVRIFELANKDACFCWEQASVIIELYTIGPRVDLI